MKIVRSNCQSGFTLLEALLTMSLIVLISIPASNFLKQTLQYFQRIPMHNQLALDSRLCMDTLSLFLSDGKPSTLKISTPMIIIGMSVTPGPPNSQISFTTSPGAQYIFSWTSNPVNTVSMTWTPPSGSPTYTKTIASHVTALVFSSDNVDPSLVHVMMRLDVAWDSSGDPTHVYTLILPDQLVHMQGRETAGT